MKNQRRMMMLFRGAAFLPLLFSAFIHAEVTIYKTDFTLMAFEKTADSRTLTVTLYGGSSDMGAASPADCIAKLRLYPHGEDFTGKPLAFSSDITESHASDEEAGEFAFREHDALVSILPLTSCPMATDFSGSYRTVARGSKEYASAWRELMQLNHTNALAVFQKGKPAEAARLLDPWILSAPSSQEYSAAIYNDYGYFLQQAGEHPQAISVFTLVKTRSPKRVTVYLNLADSLWDVQDIAKARDAYRLYSGMMEKAGQGENIPVRVAERSR